MLIGQISDSICMYVFLLVHPVNILEMSRDQPCFFMLVCLGFTFCRFKYFFFNIKMYMHVLETPCKSFISNIAMELGCEYHSYKTHYQQ